MYRSLPEGYISIGHQGNTSKWFHYVNNQRHYLKKKDFKLAQQLALKKYLYLKLKVLNGTLRNLENSNNRIQVYQDRLNDLLNDQAYLELLSNHFSLSNSEASIWMNSPYPRNNSHPENLTHPTINGLLVRSKSESMIAIALKNNHIPFRYENILQLNGKDYAPDFTIMHPLTNKIYYWEHFGMMDNSDYCDDFSNKIKVYSSNGIILGDNLIASFESKASPLNYQTINNLIKQYFE